MQALKILAVDLSSLCRWAWSIHANGRLTEGEAEGRVIDRIGRAADGYDRIVLCYDWGRTGSSFRRLACPGYKGNRQDPGEPYYAMLKAVGNRLAADGATSFPRSAADVARPEWTIEIEGKPRRLLAEADDVIASLAAWYRSTCDLDHSCLRILTGDTDLWALVSDDAGIDVLTLEEKVIEDAQVKERFEVAPEHVVELKALMGDDGDNYDPFPNPEPGQNGKKKPGIGQKTAAKLLADWACDAHAVVAAAIAGDDGGMADCVARKCLRAGGAAALEMGYTCARMVADLPIDFSGILAEPVRKPLVETKKNVTPAPVAMTVTEPEQPRTAMIVTSGEGFDRLALQPRTIEDLFDMRLANMFFNARSYPQFRTAEEINTIIFEARERGIPFATALRNAYVVKGRPAWSAAMIAGMVKASPVCTLFRIIESTDKQAVLEYQRSDEPGGPFRFVFTIEEARAAGWLKSGEKGDGKWITNPRTMLRWAAMREAARAFFPDVVSGCYTREELRGDVSNEELREEETALEGVMT